MQFSYRTLFPSQVREQLTKQMFLFSEINPQTRPVELTMEEFSRLCDAYVKVNDIN